MKRSLSALLRRMANRLDPAYTVRCSVYVDGREIARRFGDDSAAFTRHS